MVKGYLELGGSYSYAPLHAGVSLRSPNGREVYFQPGDDTASFFETVEALDEIAADRLAIIVDMAFGEYFA